MKTIPQRELRNDISRILREVEAGERFRVTVNGRPVADLIPAQSRRSTFVPWEDIIRLLEDAPLDPLFASEIDSALGATVDEL
jgi:prevent-host-death family protein